MVPRLPSPFRWLSARLRPSLLPDPPATRSEVQALVQQLNQMNEQLALLARRESQVRAVLAREASLDRYTGRLERVMTRPDTAAHVTDAVRRAVLKTYPFPYLVVDGLLPDELYECVIRGMPPTELFADRPVNKQQLTVPFGLAPAYSRRVWRHLASEVVPEQIVPALLEQFREPVHDWIAANWPSIDPRSVDFHSSDGRILLRRRGYRIPPHRDPKWGFLTAILYLARKGDSETWGTQLFSVSGDVEAHGPSPHWVEDARCTLVEDVKFRPNRMLVFLNSVGAHGAEIPGDAQPESLERCIYQFRIAPVTESMTRLKGALPEERRSYWAGKSADY